MTKLLSAVETASDFVAERFNNTASGSTATSHRYLSEDWESARTFSRSAVSYHQQEVVEATEELHKSHRQQLMSRAGEYLTKDSKAVLLELASKCAFSWSDLSRMLGVSVPAIRKWRMSGNVSSENFAKMAHLAAFASILRDRGISASTWLSTPSVPGFTVAPKHVYTSVAAPQLLDLALDGEDTEKVLDELEPRWREKFSDQGFEVVRFEDGSYGTTQRRA